jgi:hypothetical protein
MEMDGWPEIGKSWLEVLESHFQIAGDVVVCRAAWYAGNARPLSGERRIPLSLFPCHLAPCHLAPCHLAPCHLAPGENAGGGHGGHGHGFTTSNADSVTGLALYVRGKV